MNLKPKILIVDDNVSNILVIEEILSDLDVELVRARSGLEAIEKTKQHEFALILMDVQMPGMDGLEATAAIRSIERRTGGHLPILAITASALEEDRLSCLAAGMDGIVTKPVNREALLAALQKHGNGNHDTSW